MSDTTNAAALTETEAEAKPKAFSYPATPPNCGRGSRRIGFQKVDSGLYRDFSGLFEVRYVSDIGVKGARGGTYDGWMVVELDEDGEVVAEYSSVDHGLYWLNQAIEFAVQLGALPTPPKEQEADTES